MFGQIKTKLLILFLVLIAAWLSLPLVTLAQSETPYDLVNAVNTLRSLHGLEPYRIDPWLMAYAQEHSEYQASIQSGTHLHSDGTLPQDIGLQENVAGGDDGVVTVAVVVYEIWVDWGHRHILIGYSTGDIGAGVALSENGQVYYTVDIRPGEEVVPVTTSAGTSAPFIHLETSVPSENGSIIHIVSYGQTLWSIAKSYGVTVDDIRRLNAIASDSTIIHPGQKLLIRPAYTIKPTLSDETSSVFTQSLIDTAVPSMDTMLSTEPVIPSPSFNVMSTNIPADVSLKNKGIVPVVVLTIGIIGLLFVTIFGFKKSHDDKMIDDQK